MNGTTSPLAIPPFTYSRLPARRTLKIIVLIPIFSLKRITNAGTFRFKRRLLFIATALKQHAIGLEEVADGIWSIHFCHVLLGRIDERDYIIRA